MLSSQNVAIQPIHEYVIFTFFTASSFSFLYPSTIIQSSIICFGLPLDLFPNIFPLITIFNSDSLLRVCSIHFFCLVFILRMRDLSSPIVSNTSSFVLCSIQLTFSILLQIHISFPLLTQASSLFISSFFKVHVSEPYSTTTLQVTVFIIHIFNVLFTFPLRSSLLFKCFFSYCYSSFGFSVASAVIILPR